MKKAVCLALVAALCLMLAGCPLQNDEPIAPVVPSVAPSTEATTEPSVEPSALPSSEPSTEPSVEPSTEPTAPTSTSGIMEPTTALSIALKDAGLDEEDATVIKLKPDVDDGMQVYEIEFANSEIEWEYEISMHDGSIVDKEIKPLEIATDRVAASAVSAALADAGVSESDATLVKVKLDYDDGVQVYEIEFVDATTEYEYEIAASDNRVIKSETELLEIG